MPQVIGYARVSTKEQNFALQIEALKNYGVDKIVSETGSGKKPRACLDALLNDLRTGDSLVVWRLDRLGRTAHELLELSHNFFVRNIMLISIKDGIGTNTLSGKFTFGILALLAEMEHDVLVERTKAGIQAARRAGRSGGRPPIQISRIHEATELYLNSDLPVCEICRRFSISRSSFYNYLGISGITPKRHRFL